MNDDTTIDIDAMQDIDITPIPESAWDHQKVVFYCSKCNKIVEPKKKGNSLKFYCPNPECDAVVAYGTEKSIKNFFHIKQE